MVLNSLKDRLKQLCLSPHQWQALGLAINEDGIIRNGLEVLCRSDMSVSLLRKLLPEITNDYTDRMIEKLRVDSFYQSISKFQESEVSLYKREDGMLLADNLDYNRMKFLSNEVRSRLELVKPQSIAQLKRMEGITPDAIIRLLRYVKRRNLKPKKIEGLP